MSRHAAFCIALLLLPTFSGCFFIPVWRIPTHPACQCAEDRWGDAVDFVGNLSPTDQPWHDPQYCPQGVYRVAPPGSIYLPPPEPAEEPKAAPVEPPPPPLPAAGYRKPAIRIQ
jgi:hypothetical protein